MKKLPVILVSFILFLSSVGVVLGCALEYFDVTSGNTAHVGDIITVVGKGSGSYPDSETIKVCDSASCDDTCQIKENVVILIDTYCEPDYIRVWKYKALSPGTIKFWYVTCSKEVTILPKPHPMFSFMKILGLGKSD